MINLLISLLCLVPIFLVPSSAMAQQTSPQTSTSQQSDMTLPNAPSVHKAGPGTSSPHVSPSNPAAVDGPVTDDGKARLTLLSNVSSKSPSGSSFMARLEHPVQVEGKTVLPQGSVVEGHLETVHARRIMRPGALRMICDRVKLPDGTIQRASLVVVSSESKSVKTDDEGTLHPTISKKRLAFQFGGTAAAAKLADDIAEEAVAAGAGTARLYGLAGAGVFLFFQKGREVKLHEGEVVEAEFVVRGQALPVRDSRPSCPQ
jgi:hypothetical protein